MKDSKFTELLNLYIDQEISADEAALLELEIARNPERRKVYQQYCRMHRASTLLFESHRSENIPSGSKLAEAARRADEKVALFPQTPEPRSLPWFSMASVFTAAACVAFVVIRHNSHSPELSQPTAAPVAQVVAPAKAQQIVAAQSVAEALTPVTMAPRSLTLGSQSVFINQVFDSRDALAQQNSDLSTMPSMEWMKQVKLSPMRVVPLEELSLDNKNHPKQDLKNLRNPKSTQGNVEMTAFQFQR